MNRRGKKKKSDKKIRFCYRLNLCNTTQQATVVDKVEGRDFLRWKKVSFFFSIHKWREWF
jgi:hypothetical protein